MNIKRSAEWLACLKVGDKVAVHNRSVVGIKTVTGTTKTLIKVGAHQRFRKSDGGVVGGDRWDCCAIGKVTDEVCRKIYESGIIYKYRHIHDTLLPIHMMAKIVAMVAEYRKDAAQ